MLDITGTTVIDFDGEAQIQVTEIISELAPKLNVSRVLLFAESFRIGFPSSVDVSIT